MDLLLRLRLVRFRKRVAAFVDLAMDIPALDRIGRVVPLALDPLQIGQARAVAELVDHPGRQQRDIPDHLRKGQLKLALLGNRISRHGMVPPSSIGITVIASANASAATNPRNVARDA